MFLKTERTRHRTIYYVLVSPADFSLKAESQEKGIKSGYLYYRLDVNDASGSFSGLATDFDIQPFFAPGTKGISFVCNPLIL